MPIDIENDTLEIAMQKLKARENSLRKLEAISGMGSWEVDLLTHKSIWSDQSYINYGLDKETTTPTYELFLSSIIPEDLEAVKLKIQEGIKSGKVASFTCRIKKADNSIATFFLNGQAIYNENSKPIKLIGTTQDITAQVKLKTRAKELSALIEHSSSEIYIANFDTLEYVYVNQGASKATGYSINEFASMTVRDIIPLITDEKVQELKNRYLETGYVLYRNVHQRKDGTQYTVQSYLHEILYEGKKCFVAFTTNISDIVALEAQQKQTQSLLKEQTDKLRYLAHHDTLTDLPNRALFKDRLSQAIAHTKRNKEQFALLFIDLDQFKKINDSLGHHVGDEVLIETAARIKSVLREEDTLARLGGDEFTIIIQNFKTLEAISHISQKIIDIMKEPINVFMHNLYVTSSIGISIYPDDTTNDLNLIKYADAAMYKAKDEGRNNYQFYSSNMTVQAFEHVVMESGLRVAIKEEQFVVYFQPQINTQSEKILGMEALIRWNHPSLGLVLPGDFIPIAEQSGLIVEIDRIVMKQAIKQFSKWKNSDLNPGQLSLNLAMKQLAKDDFIEYLQETMRSVDFKPEWLELEVTESQVMRNPESSIQKLNKIHAMGIKISIDDFGTGYSSLSYLKKLPLDKLKIDQSFVRDIPEDEDDVAITKAIIALGKSLNLTLIAEGVETIEQRDFIRDNGCELIQGYFYSRPVPADELQKLLETNLRG